MTKLFLLAAALAPLAAQAQTPPGASAFQQEGWLRPADGVLSPNLESRRLDGQTGPVLNRPLSADEVRSSVQTLSDGSHLNNSETNRFYRDSQGRMLTRTSTGAVLFDPVAGFTYDITDRNKTYTKSPISPNATVTIAAAAHYSSVSSSSGSSSKSRNHKGSDPVTEDLNPQLVNGVLAKGARVTVTIPTGKLGNDRDLKVVNERWYSDDLKLLVRSSNSDPRFGVTTYELKNITQAAPDASLFQIPPDYTEGH
jgi:hypothetical protein